MPRPDDVMKAAQDAAAEMGRSVRDQQTQLQAVAIELDEIEEAERLGVDGAAVRAAELRTSKVELEQHLEELRTRQQVIDARLRKLLDQHTAEAAVRRQQEIARLAPLYLKLARQTEEAAHQIGHSLGQMQDIGGQLATAIGTVDASRLLNVTALKDRAQHALFLPLSYPNSSNPLMGDGGTRSSYFGYTVQNRAACKETFVERTELVLDHIETVFASEASARHRATRIDATGQSAHVLPVVGTGLFQIVLTRLRGAAARLKKGSGA